MDEFDNTIEEQEEAEQEEAYDGDAISEQEEDGMVEQELEQEQEIEEKEEPKPKRKISSKVKGLAKLCRELKSQGKTDEEIIQEVANKYIEAGKTEKEAKGRAKSWVKYMVWER